MVFARARQIHTITQKPSDIVWNRFFARPLASFMLVALERTRLTPNQLTFISLTLFAVASFVLACVLIPVGVALGVALVQLSYVFDCADGQLARLRNQSSFVGAHLDFVVDALKAFLFIAALTLRLAALDPGWPWLIEGLLGMVAAGTGLSLTTFMRRAEFQAATGVHVDKGVGDYGTAVVPAAPVRRSSPPVRWVEALGHLVLHYPSHIVFFAIFSRLDLLLHIYLGAHGLYAGRALLQIFWRLGRFAGQPPATT